MPRGPRRDQIPLFSDPSAGKFHYRLEGDFVVSPSGETYEPGFAIAQLPWVTATMYPPPHQYCIFEQCPVTAWEILNLFIAKHSGSYLAYFRAYQKPNRYWDFEGRRYWRTASRDPGGHVTHMLNRALFTDAEPPRRVDEGAVPANLKEWNAPPWELPNTPWPEWYVKGADGEYHYTAALDPRYRKRKP